MQRRFTEAAPSDNEAAGPPSVKAAACGSAPAAVAPAEATTPEVTTVCSWCSAPESIERPLMQCSVCKLVIYCNDACQRQAWPSHKHQCKRAQAFDAALQAKSAATRPVAVATDTATDAPAELAHTGLARKLSGGPGTSEAMPEEVVSSVQIGSNPWCNQTRGKATNAVPWFPCRDAAPSQQEAMAENEEIFVTDERLTATERPAAFALENSLQTRHEYVLKQHRPPHAPGSDGCWTV